MTMVNNISINDETYEEAGVGVEIISAEADADAESIKSEAEETELRLRSNDAAANPSPLSKRFIIFWGLVLAIVAVVSYAAGSSSASSSSKMTNINQMEQQPKAIKKGGIKFDYVGEGYCLDDNPNDYGDPNLPHGNLYPFLGYFHVDAKECAELCAACPGEGQGGLVLRGFEIEVFTADPLTSECYCQVEKSSISTVESFENIATGVCNAQIYSANYFRVGTGEIASVVNSPPQECWKVSSKSGKVCVAWEWWYNIFQLRLGGISQRVDGRTPWRVNVMLYVWYDSRQMKTKSKLIWKEITCPHLNNRNETLWWRIWT